MFKKFLSLLLAVAVIFGISSFSFAKESATDRAIRFGDDGKFRIMHVTDTHLEDYNVDASVWSIGEACDRENPDIVIITGDNVQNCENPDDTKKLIDKLMSVFEERNIPVAVTFGNHDSETGAMSREELMAYYNTFSCSVSVDDGEALSGCGTYNIPVLASDGDTVKFNLWVFDSGDYDGEGYGCVMPDQIEWYKRTSDALAEANGGERVKSLVFQHIIVADVYDALEKTNGKKLFSFEHIDNDGEYYRFNPENENFGTLNETPCSGYYNYGQFEAMVEKGDVLAMFTGHDHTNAFGVKHMGIDIVNSLSTRYNGDRFSTQYGYRMIEVDENNTVAYSSKVVHWYDFFTVEDAVEYKKNGDGFGFKTAADIAFKGFFQKLITVVYRSFGMLVTGRQITYPD
ncbi:MAG: metallophosphoesterase [Clostridia bacterium]|nr:metallophosphoesterase [Clostridia bacterium]